MRAVNGGIKSYPITLVKESIVFVEGDTNENWQRFKGQPLIYLGVHNTGQMMFETPNEGTIYLECPTIGCIIPPEYKEHVFDEVDDFFDELDDEVPEERTPTDFEAHRAKETNNNVSLPAVLRAAAISVEQNEFGGKPDGAILIISIDGTYQYRPMNLNQMQQAYAFEWCKLNAMGVAYFSDLEEINDGPESD